MTISMQIDDWRGRKVVDRDGHKIGKIEDVYFDETDGHPEWALVRTGLFGTRDTFIPLDRARLVDRDIVVPYTKDFVKDAPGVDGDDVLSIAEEAQLAAYYERDFAFEGGHLSYSGARDAAAGVRDPAPSDPSRTDEPGDDRGGRDAADAEVRDVDDAEMRDRESERDTRQADVGSRSTRRLPSELTRARWVTVAMPADEAERLGYTAAGDGGADPGADDDRESAR